MVTGDGVPRRRKGAYGEGGMYDDMEDEDGYMEEEGEEEVDAVDLYCSRTMGRLAVTLAAGVVGSLIGTAISQVSIIAASWMAVD